MKNLLSLNIQNQNHLFNHLGTSKKELDNICDHIENFYFQQDKKIKNKIRHLATPQGRLREILDKLLILLQRISLPSCIHGGRKGCSNITNAAPHIKKATVLQVDIENFFPSVTNTKVYKTFCKQLNCSPDVSRYLTRLTTLNGSLPQGSPTSTILGSIATIPFAIRADNLTKKHQGNSSLYVDDFSVSGPKYIASLKPVYEKIIKQEGYKPNPSKTKVVNNDEEQIVTGVRIDKGLDAPSKMIKNVRKQIDQIKDRPHPKEILSIKGKINYIKNLNKGAGLFLGRRLNKILLSLEKK